MASIFRLSKDVFNAVKGVVTKPESFRVGEDFEKYVQEYVFPEPEYTLVYRTDSYLANKERYAEESLKPDFLFRCNATKQEFYIEAKFRSSIYDGAVEWCNTKQLQRYRAIDREKPVFLALGIGGSGAIPLVFYVIPMNKIKYPRLFESYIKPYSFYLDKPIFPSYLWKLRK